MREKEQGVSRLLGAGVGLLSAFNALQRPYTVYDFMANGHPAGVVGGGAVPVALRGGGAGGDGGRGDAHDH